MKEKPPPVTKYKKSERKAALPGTPCSVHVLDGQRSFECPKCKDAVTSDDLYRQKKEAIEEAEQFPLVNFDRQYRCPNCRVRFEITIHTR